MPDNKYLKVAIDGQELELPAEGIGISINYKLEDIEDFQKKKSSESYDFTFPATPHNDEICNTFHNPGVEDLTADEVFSNHRSALIEANGEELLVGKAFLTKAVHNSKPVSYTFDFYGNNADWIIDLKETTLFDLLKHLTFPFTKPTIVDSWLFDGTDEALPYVFAPVRYRNAMQSMYADPLITTVDKLTDYNMIPVYMKPSISKYWILYWGFKLAGYRIDSTFFNSEYFRRQVMPWTWGNFLDSEGTKNEIHRFLAIGTDVYYNLNEGTYIGQDRTGPRSYLDLNVVNDTDSPAYDLNNTVPDGDYTYDVASGEMRWTYNTPNYGILEANLSITIAYDYDAKAELAIFKLDVDWFVNGVLIKTENIADYGQGTFSANVTSFFAATVSNGDYISCKVHGRLERSKNTISVFGEKYNSRIKVMEFKLDYFRIPLGGIIAFDGMYSLKKYKFLDFLKGVFDEFNIAVQTDSIGKVVTMEPLHAYATGADLTVTNSGYFNGDFIDWERLQDLSKDSTLNLFSDYEREVIFQYKDDTNDGALKVVQDRNQHKVCVGKYVLPSRFKAGKKEVTNNFFSPVMHYDVNQWSKLTGITPQMIVMVPENISNTSRDEAQNTFSPKSAYYKGLINGVGGWVFDGEVKTELPFMFAVNYQPGGENDPVLSYCDERIGLVPDGVRAAGLLRRFYLQRLAIMRHGKYYSTSFLLHNKDVSNWLHREHIICRGQRWELLEINNYRPLEETTTNCELRKWTPITENDSLSVYPGNDGVVNGSTSLIDQFDIQYNPLKCLSSDIPT